MLKYASLSAIFSARADVIMKVMLFDLNLNESWIRVLDAAIVLNIV